MKRSLFILVLCLPVFLIGKPMELSGREKNVRGANSTGLFFDEKEIPEFRRMFKSDPLFAELRDKLTGVDRKAERKFLQSEVRFNDQLYDIKHVSDVAVQMAFLYVFSGDEDAANLAIQCVRTLMRFPKWDYFLDGGETMIGLQRAPGATIAVSLCVEFLGDLVSDEERRRWLETMGERGNEPSFQSTYG
ncbi:hypothetical protein MJD09_18570, partial [bacterium]|nr:hypothetical protein [bacterium]